MTSLLELSRPLASAFISSTWQAAVLAGALAVTLRMLPGATATTRYAMWSAALGIFALLPFLPATHPVAAVHSPAMHLAPWWSVVIATLWLTLSLVRLIQLAVSAHGMRGIARNAIPVAEWPACTAPGTTRTAVLCTSTDVARPSVLGFFSPRILIPDWLFDRITHEELEQIVLHEMQHLRRRDDWVNLLQKLGLVLFPLNPALFWVERRLCLERELACDDGVLQITHAPRAYASALVNLAEQGLVRSRLSLALGAWERRSELATRVHAILRSTTVPRRSSSALAAGLIVVLAGGAGVLSRTPQLVSFAAAPSIAVATSEAPAPAYQPSRFDETNSARPMLVKAVLPEAPASPDVIARVRKNNFHTRPNVANAHPAHRRTIATRRPIPQQHLTLTAFDQTPETAPAPAPRLVYTVIQTTSFRSYAAVPTPDGWLIIQL